MSYYNHFAKARRLLLPTQRYIAAMGTKPEYKQSRLWDDFVVGLYKDDLWNNFDSFWILGGHNNDASRINLIDPAQDTLQVTGSPVFTVNNGWAGVSTTGYLDAQRNLTALSKYAQNDMHLGVWDNGTVVNQNSMVAGEGTVDHLWIAPSYNGSPGSFYARIQSATSTPLNLGNGGAGHKLIERTGSTAAAMYKNGSNIHSSTTTSSAVTTAPLRLLTNIQLGNTTQIFAAHIGSSLGSTKASALYNRINTLRTETAAL